MAKYTVRVKAVADISMTIDDECEDIDGAIDIACQRVHEAGELFWRDFEVHDFTVNDVKVEEVEPEEVE